jgi:uroporphyrin-III C-methyltransferase
VPTRLSTAARLQAPEFDPGLLTLYALHALNTADVVLHDALVPPEILALAASPHVINVGKRASGARTHQLRINQRLIALARDGMRVLRLKGGDPLIFGRGGEEALALAAAGIPFRIVPGVSAGIGGTAGAGIPLTHRTLARNVVFATGHAAASGELPGDIDFAALARIDVVVFYMALRHAGTIAQRLIATGRAPDDAVAFISDATTPRQRVTAATLATAGAVAARLDAQAPTLIVVGSVLALRDMITPLQQAEPMTLAPTPRAATGDVP